MVHELSSKNVNEFKLNHSKASANKIPQKRETNASEDYYENYLKEKSTGIKLGCLIFLKLESILFVNNLFNQFNAVCN